MFSKTKTVLTAALIIGSASLSAVSAFAGDNSGEYSGGFVLPGSMDGVNPVYHSDWSPLANRGKATQVIDQAASRNKAGQAFGSVAPHTKTVLPAAAPAKDYNGYYQSGKD